MKAALILLFVAVALCQEYAWDATNYAAGGNWNYTTGGTVFWTGGIVPPATSATTKIDLSGLTGTINLYYSSSCYYPNADLVLDGGILNVMNCFSSVITFKSVSIASGKSATLQTTGYQYSFTIDNDNPTAVQNIPGTITLRNCTLRGSDSTAKFEFDHIIVRNYARMGGSSTCNSWKTKVIDAYYYGSDSSSYKVYYPTGSLTSGTIVNCYADSTWSAGSSTWLLIYNYLTIAEADRPTVNGCTGGIWTSSTYSFSGISALGGVGYVFPAVALLLVSLLF